LIVRAQGGLTKIRASREPNKLEFDLILIPRGSDMTVPSSVKKKISGRKPIMDKREHEKSKKMALLIFFSDEENTSILCFFRENNYEESLPFHLTRVVTADKRLGDSVAMRKEAYDITERTRIGRQSNEGVVARFLRGSNQSNADTTV
jgi:hypothetical protein